MSSGSRPTKPAGDRRAGRRSFTLWALLLPIIVWTIAPGPLRADTILLQSGEAIDGAIVDATRNTVVVRRTIGGMRQMGMRDIAEVQIELAQGQSITGRLLSWVDGVHRLHVGDEVVSVRSGLVLGRAPYEEPETPSRPTPPTPPPSSRQSSPGVGPATPVAPPAGEGAGGAAVEVALPERAAEEAVAPEAPLREDPAPESAAEKAPAPELPVAEVPGAERPVVETPAAERHGTRSPAPGTAVDSGPAAEASGPEPPAPEAPSAARPAAEGPADESAAPESGPAGRTSTESIIAKSAAAREATGGLLTIGAVVDSEQSDADELVFRIELSRPAEQTVALIYGTVDGTAKAGEDYEPREGILTLAPGTRQAQVRVPLFERQPRKADGRFELFLAADPTIAKIVDQRVVATIPGTE